MFAPNRAEVQESWLGSGPGDGLLYDTRSHEVSERVEEVRLCRGRSYGLVFETVPAVT